METAGYPSFTLYLIMLIGIPLALNKPFKALLMITFVLSAADSAALTFTRTKVLGPYFNANDACLFIALMAVIPYILSHKRNIIVPPVTKWILAVLLLGFVQSLFFMGKTYETIRALRWAINLPIYFIIAATLVDKKEKVRPFLIALFLGSIVASVEHIIFVRSRLELYEFGGIQQIRTIAFSNPGLWMLIAGLIWLPKFKGIDRKFFIAAGVLFAMSVILGQTRSIWLSSVATLPICWMIFKHSKISIMVMVKRTIVPALLISLLIFTVMKFITPGIDPLNIIIERLDAFSPRDFTYYSTYTRVLSFQIEIKNWLQGTLIFGRGLAYFSPYYIKGGPVAWGHLGHVTTLAQLGIVGLIVYSFYLPIAVIKSSKNLWQVSSNEIKYFALFAGVVMVWAWICFIMSDSFLGQHAIDGMIFGAVWRQSRLMNINETERVTRPFVFNSLNKFLRSIVQH